MNKRVFIIHGWTGNPREPMLWWLKVNLEKSGQEVFTPEMPETDTPKIESWVGKLKEVVEPDLNTILVGHSIGCQAVVRFIETLPQGAKITGVVLIAPWMELDAKTMEEEGEDGIEIAKPWVETPINFEKVKSHIGKTVAIFSDDDPYVPIASQRDLFKKELNAEIITEHNKGHFAPSDNITELPSALNAILEMTQ